MLSSGQSFMRIDSLDGEEPYNAEMKMIRLAGFRHELNIPIAPLRPSIGPQSTMRRTYCNHGFFTVTKGLDRTSGGLFDLSSRAAVIPNVAVYMCRSQESSTGLSSYQAAPQPFLSIAMTNVVIARFHYELTSAWPIEEIDFHYTSISWILDWIDPVDGTAVNLGGVGWNGQTNAPVPPVNASNAIPGAVKFE